MILAICLLVWFLASYENITVLVTEVECWWHFGDGFVTNNFCWQFIEKFEMLVTALTVFVINILGKNNQSSGTNVPKMSPTSNFGHLHSNYNVTSRFSALRSYFIKTWCNVKSLFGNPEGKSILRTFKIIQKYSNLFCMHSYIWIMQFQNQNC